MKKEDAIYVRQSVDRIDSISIESQIEFCRYETRGAPHRVYADKGYSGKNTARPQFQQMLDDIRKGEISRVICYKLDRCSRSILDFTNLLEELQRYKVEFVSCTEKFDTASPMGRAMLNICVVFAQLERETIQQRVSDAYHSRSQKGFYMGGRIPYGYQLEPYILQGKKTSRYVKCEEEAQILYQIYTLYAQPQCSIGDIIQYLGENSISNSRTKDGHWMKSYIHSIIKNPIYVRADFDVYSFFRSQSANLLNPPEDYIGVNGCYLFTDKGEKSKDVSLDGHNVVLAPHEGFIPADLWLQCRRKCMNNKQVAKPTKAKHSWLAGKLKCGLCGYAMVIRKSGSKPGSKRYFMCSHHLNNIAACPGIGCVGADDLEELILQDITQKVTALGVLSKQSATKEDPHIRELNIKIAKSTQEVEDLLSKLSQANETVMAYISQKIAALDAQMEAWKRELERLEDQKKGTFPNAREVRDAMNRWEMLSNSDKITVVDSLIESISLEKEKVSIRWRL